MKFCFPVAFCADCGSLRMQVLRSYGRGYVAQLLDNSQIIYSESYRSLIDAQEALVLQARCLTEERNSPPVWQTISVSIPQLVSVFLALSIVLYGLPTLIEAIILNAGGRLSYVLVGDLLAYIVIFLNGRKVAAVSIYIGARLAEIWLVRAGLLPLDAMLWITDALPSLFAAGLLCRKLLFLPKA